MRRLVFSDFHFGEYFLVALIGAGVAYYLSLVVVGLAIPLAVFRQGMKDGKA